MEPKTVSTCIVTALETLANNEDLDIPSEHRKALPSMVQEASTAIKNHIGFEDYIDFNGNRVNLVTLSQDQPTKLKGLIEELCATSEGRQKWTMFVKENLMKKSYPTSAKYHANKSLYPF
jgi:hypothetical protein